MDLFVGLDVSVGTTSLCVMDAEGKVLKEGKVESEPSTIDTMLTKFSTRLKRSVLRPSAVTVAL